MADAALTNGTTAERKPRRPLLAKSKVVKYLEDRHCILWGFSGSIDSPEGREKAADWLVEIIETIRNGQA